MPERYQELDLKISKLDNKIANLKNKQLELKKQGKKSSKLDEEINQNLELYEEYKTQIPKKYRNIELTPEETSKINSLFNEIKGMEDGYDKTFKIAEANKIVADKIPSKLGKQLSTVQTMSQLLNTKTAIRNIVGNAGFQALEIANTPQKILLDKIFSLGTKERTVFLTSPKEGLKSFKKGLGRGYKEAKKGVDIGFGSQFDLPTSTFKGNNMAGKIMKNLEKALSYELKVADRAFYTMAHDKSLSNQVKSILKKQGKKITKESMDSIAITDEMLLNAHNEGLYSTFQDTNKLSDLFTSLKKAGNKPTGGDFGLGDILLKYPKTPANLLARGIDYSPVGIIKSIAKMATNIKSTGKINQRELIDGISRGLTGTAGILIAKQLADSGVITTDTYENKKVHDTLKSVGVAPYTINISALKRYVGSMFNKETTKPQSGDTILKYDWFQPLATTMAIGGDLSKYFKNKGDAKKISSTEFLQGIGIGLLATEAGVQTLINQPLLQGISNLFEYGTDDTIRRTASDIIPSFMPTALNQVRQLIDNKSRSASTKADEDPLGISMTLNKIINKVPIASKILPVRKDTIGNDIEMYQGGTNNPLNVFFNPAFMSKYKKSPEIDLLINIYEKTGETKQLPRVALKTYTFTHEGKKQTFKLNNNQQTELQEMLGKYSIEELKKLSKDKEFLNVDYDTQAEHINNLYTSISKYAKKYMMNKYKEDVIKQLK